MRILTLILVLSLDSTLHLECFTVGIIDGVVLQELVKESIWLCYEEHQLVEYLPDHMLPILLLPSLLCIHLVSNEIEQVCVCLIFFVGGRGERGRGCVRVCLTGKVWVRE